MSRIVIVSNRLPISINREEGELIYHPSAGGLATGLHSLDKNFDKIWIGWAGQPIDDAAEQDKIRSDFRNRDLVPIFLSQEEVALYYEGFSNKTVWPLFHYFTQNTTYSESLWEAYRSVNQKFADAVIPEIQEGDMIWVHDYQLMLVPQMLRQALPNHHIGFFLHIPFPSYEIFRLLPWRDTILEGMLGADLIGFHTFDYMRHFLSVSYRLGGYESDFGNIQRPDRNVKVDVYPMGIDYEKFNAPAPPDNDIQHEIKKHLSKDHKLVISIDRLDYTKGIPDRIRAFGEFLERYPAYQGKITLAMVVVPSRGNVDEYQALKEEVDLLVGRINGAMSTFGWSPILYFYRPLPFPDLLQLYQMADIALVTPLRDGMNLVAKEYVASRQEQDGVLILSEMAGAANELVEGLIINPHDQEDIVQALLRACTMPQEEQHAHMKAMQKRVKLHNVEYWAAHFIEALKDMAEEKQLKGAQQLKGPALESMALKYAQASKRLLLLDYDGTLMGFRKNPDSVIPDENITSLLQALCQPEENTVVVISGRGHHKLDKWLGHLPLDMSAEHGVWYKEDGEWRDTKGIDRAWKPKVREFMEEVVRRTPGTFIEEKEYSLAWHYRKADKEFIRGRIREFMDSLLYMIANQDLHILEGNKVVEVKNTEVSKGTAAKHWLHKDNYDFVLAIGDDVTDEDTFKALPESAYTVKVGKDPSVARWRIPDVDAVRELLKTLSQH